MTIPRETAFGEKLLSADDVAAVFGKNRRWVYKQVERNGLPAYKLGRSLAFEVSAVRAWLDARRIGEWTLSEAQPSLERPERGEGDG